MNPVATSDAAFRGGACPTPEYTIAYTGNYTTSADANCRGAREPVAGRREIISAVVAVEVRTLHLAANIIEHLLRVMPIDDLEPVCERRVVDPIGLEDPFQAE